VDDFAEPLTIDWQSDTRAKLEVAMYQGIAVVAYDCKTIRLLPACRVEGTYGFVGTTTKEQVIRLENGYELGANLPVSAPPLKAKLTGDMQRGATLDVALMTIGKRVATLGDASSADLKGDCAGATHFVRAATVGAFAMGTGSKAHVETAVEVFGLGAKGSSSSSTSMSTGDGSLDDCRKATPDDSAPPEQCRALLRLQLRRIGIGAKTRPTGGLAHNPCPSGLVLSEGKCTIPTANVVRLCTYGDAADCKAQCDRGDAGSCANLGLMFDLGQGVKPDASRAAQLFETACEAGNAPACGRRGEMFLAGSGPGVDAGRAREFLRRGCSGGWMAACTRLGDLERKTGLAVNVLAMFERACRGGDGDGCASYGVIFGRGVGIPADPMKAVTYYTLGCDQNSLLGCTLLGEAYEKGEGVTADGARAADIYRRACDGGYADGCNRLCKLGKKGACAP
jgi:TPR repeat protein